MADTARLAGATGSRRDAVLEALAFSAERLLLAGEWRTATDEVLPRLGEAADASRVSVIENAIGPDGRVLLTLVAEWCAPDVRPALGDPIVDHRPWDEGFARWAAAMLSTLVTSIWTVMARHRSGSVRAWRARSRAAASRPARTTERPFASSCRLPSASTWSTTDRRPSGSRCTTCSSPCC